MMGPALKVENINVDPDLPLNCGFRIIHDYFIQTDGNLTRLDIKYAGKQFSVGFITSGAISPGNQPDDYHMITPSKAILNCINVQTNKTELLKALKELVTDLEKDEIENGK